MAAPNRELEPVNLRFLKSELAETSKARYPEMSWLKVKGPRGTFLKNQDIGDIRFKWDSTEIDNRTVNYRPLKQLGSPGLIVESPKHRTSIARIRVATPAELRVVDKLLMEVQSWLKIQNMVGR